MWIGIKQSQDTGAFIYFDVNTIEKLVTTDGGSNWTTVVLH